MDQDKKRILVIRLSAMGDCALAVPVLIRLIKKYPHLQISVVTKAFFVPIFKVLPPSVQVIAAHTKREHKGMIGIYRLSRELKKMGVDAIADLHNVLRSKLLCAFFSLSKVKTATIDKGRAEKKALTRTENKVFKPLKTTPQRYAEVFEELGYPIDLEEQVVIEKPKPSEAVRKFKRDSTKKWIGIAPFAAHNPKTYPLDLMKEVLDYLNGQDGYKILLFGGGKKEKEKLENLSAPYKNVENITGRFSFEEEIQLIAHLQLMISMDSGNGHLAALFDIPVITIWGATHPYAGFAPFGQPQANQLLPDLKKYPLLPTSVFGNKEMEGYEEVMRSIAPEKIINRIQQILSLPNG